MRTLSFVAGICGLPLLVPLVLIGWLTPRYVPTASLASAAASTPSPDLARARMVASFVGRCRGDWNFDRFRASGDMTLYSWESDAGLLSRTRIVCRPGAPCSVTAQALVDRPATLTLGGKRVPTRLRNCGIATPDWAPSDPRD